MLDQPASPQPIPAPARRQVGSLALAVAMLLSAVGGGVIGSIATLSAVQHVPTSRPQTAAMVASPGEASVGTRVADAGDEAAITRVFRQASPAVVSVSKSGGASGPLGEFRRRGEGTGIVVDRGGLILTNHHVIEGATRIVVRFADGATATATVAGSDPGTDLAVLKADLPEGHPVATLGDSDKVEPGQTAIAIGSPFGLSQTVTAGIISAVNREWGSAGGRPMRGLIQTDAPVNPGNSGGPLLNIQGETIGIATAIESPIQGSVGIGFAIPINEAKRLLPQLARGERVEHPWLGISGSALMPQLATQLGLSVEQGILIHEVIADGPAARAGLRGGRSTGEADVPSGGDVVTAVDGRPLKTVQELSAYLSTLHVGDEIRLTILRDGQVMELTVTLGAWPAGQRS